MMIGGFAVSMGPGRAVITMNFRGIEMLDPSASDLVLPAWGLED